MSDGICRAGRNLAFIDADGFVYPCITFKSTEHVISQRTIPFPNLNQNSFSEIWHNNELFKEIRKLQAEDFEQCIKCKYDCYCKKCIGVNYKETGTLTVPSMKYCSHSDNLFSFLTDCDCSIWE